MSKQKINWITVQAIEHLADFLNRAYEESPEKIGEEYWDAFSIVIDWCDTLPEKLHYSPQDEYPNAVELDDVPTDAIKRIVDSFGYYSKCTPHPKKIHWADWASAEILLNWLGRRRPLSV
jgi:hypothetical protein